MINGIFESFPPRAKSFNSVKRSQEYARLSVKAGVGRESGNDCCGWQPIPQQYNIYGQRYVHLEDVTCPLTSPVVMVEYWLLDETERG